MPVSGSRRRARTRERVAEADRALGLGACTNRAYRALDDAKGEDRHVRVMQNATYARMHETGTMPDKALDAWKRSLYRPVPSHVKVS